MARILLGLVAFAVLASPAPAVASEHLGDRDVSFLSLKVNARGEALVSYRRADGQRRDVLIWGAVNAHSPDADRPQVSFRYDYSGGWKSHGTAEYARSFKDTCRAVRRSGRSSSASPRARRPTGRTGRCRAGGGSHRCAVSPRSAPSTTPSSSMSRTGRARSRCSRFRRTGPTAGRCRGCSAALTYQGEAVYGFRTPSATRSDPYARFVYIDTFNSVYGPGWKRDTGIVTHRGNGAFCYSFVAQAPPPGYPSREPRGPGNGERHRVTVMGPGVTPVVQWEGEGLDRYSAASDRVFNRRFDQLVGANDRVCTPRALDAPTRR